MPLVSSKLSKPWQTLPFTPDPTADPKKPHPFQAWRVWTHRKNRPFIIRDERRWLFTGMRFVSPESYEARYAVNFKDLDIAEGMARHLRLTGYDAGARRSTYDECKRLIHAAIKSAEPGERIVQARFPKKNFKDGGEFWPHR